METVFHDLRYGLRILFRAPAFTSVAILTLALGIGSTAAVFSVVNALFLRPLPYPEADRLVFVWGHRSQPDRQLPVSLPVALEVASRDRTFDRLGVWTSAPDTRFSLTTGGEPRDVQYAVVSTGLFPLLGAEALRGRRFGPEDDRMGAAPVAMISHALWQQRFGGTDTIIGRPIVLDGRPHIVVGVLPATLRFIEFPRAPDVWLPLGSDPFRDRRYAPVASMGVVAHLRNGVTLGQARGDMAALAHRIGRQFPPLREWTLVVRPMRDQLAADRRPLLSALMGAVGLVLLLTCANLANLLLAQATTRAREIAVRLALGASRRRVVRQLFTESIALALLGGLAGLLVAEWATDALVAVAAGRSDPFVPWRAAAPDLAPDGAMLIFAAAMSTACAVMFGLGPAWHASRSTLASSAQETTRATRGRHRARATLIAAEVALSVVLLAGAGLFVRSFVNLAHVDPGFSPEHALAMDVPLSSGEYDASPRIITFVDRLTTSIAALPGVRAIGASTIVPLRQAPSTDIRLEGAASPEPGREPRAEYSSVTPGWFHAVGVPIVRGRALNDADDAGAGRVAVINSAMARMYFHDREPIGHRVALSTEALRFPDPNGPPVHDFPSAYRTIVGVVGDVRQQGLDTAPAAAMYVPLAQAPTRVLTLFVRGDGDPASLGQSLARAIHAIDPAQPVGEVRSLDAIVTAAADDSRIRFRAVGALSVAALLLAVVGIYGVVAYAVTQRTREIGIRIALGASRRHVVALSARAGLVPALVGGAVGLPVAALMAQGIRASLFGVPPNDVTTFGIVCVLLAGASVVASWVPARRAARIEPSEALRSE